MGTDFEEVYSEWQNNPKFKEAFKKNPQEALQEWGFKLNEEDLKKILKFKQENEELDKRVNK